jgi:tRNA threonylcarbamoyladenosine dehydratase
VAPPDASRQPIDALEGDGTLNCQGYGSAVTVTATFGLVAASIGRKLSCEQAWQSQIN